MIEFEWFDDDEEEDGIVEDRSNMVTLELNANLVRNCQNFNRCEDGTLPDAAFVVEMAMEMACQMAEDAGVEFMEDDDVALRAAKREAVMLKYGLIPDDCYIPKTFSSDSTKGHELSWVQGAGS
jgi:hypothetical protein